MWVQPVVSVGTAQWQAASLRLSLERVAKKRHVCHGQANSQRLELGRGVGVCEMMKRGDDEVSFLSNGILYQRR
jgi:hypothetical protein